MPYAASRNTSGIVKIGTSAITQIKDLTADPGVDALVNRASGSADPSFIAQKGWKPVVRFTSSMVGTLLGIAGADAANITGGTSPVLAYFPKLTPGSAARSSSSDSSQWSITAGIILPRRLSVASVQAGGRNEAEITYDVMAVFDGTNNPITHTTATNPTAAAATEKWTMAPVSIGGVLYDAESLDVDCGLKELLISYNGLPYPSWASVIEREPVITIKSTDNSLIDIIGPAGQNFASAKTFLHQVPLGGGNTSDASAAHIKMDWVGGVYAYLGPNTGRVGGAAEVEIKLRANNDITHGLVTITVGAAIAA